jgi:sugar phosphate isomerase/epimerase
MDAPDRDRHEEVVVDRLRRMAAIAAAHSLRLLHENEAGIFGETSANCRKLFAAIPDDAFQAVFDPSNFVAAGEDAFDESFPALRDRIGYLHVKDSVRETGTIVVAGRGDGRLREILDALRDRDGLFLSLEPHLSLAGPFRGFTGPELFEEDFRALTAMLRELDIRYG